jgi:hypothetical protein
MDCLRDFATSLGVSNIYLATDNVTLFTEGPNQYPQYGWFGLKRVMREYKDDVWAKDDPHHHEKSRQQDVAVIMVRMYMSIYYA